MTSWTTPDDVERKLRRRWESGGPLRAFAEDVSWEPVGVLLRGPTAGEVAAGLDQVQAWVRVWQRVGGRLGRLEYRRVGGRLVGTNELPARLWVDSYDGLWSAVGAEKQVRRFTELVAAARTSTPRLVEWMLGHPLRVLELESEWPAITRTIQWIDVGSDHGRYLRQIDVPGVDTKFIERHRIVLATLLDHQLDVNRIDLSKPRADFAGRYGFLRRPRYARLRSLTPGRALVDGYGELMFRTDELARRPLPGATVYVIENETTYLAFPAVDDALALFGGGYAVSVLESLSWLSERDVVYWGDIDTHGFAILDRLRRHFPQVRSMLMDRATLLAHEGQWVTEEAQHVAHLENLRPDETDLYSDLVEDVLGPSIRLEQERIWYPLIERAIAAAATGVNR
ncbi:Wadjet anti-phage system protein JetD domain-containing protein [Jiangella mangrovi]|uniref:DUF3322 and DUF2220 domain-containing protein n=1 Tax=Jiangella mangrovi TaxID=1524084 RepID=A0A7W9LJL4_9ACTN|nr:Wadjet anti-phage system protein JetD domain-containing protein [Jiangella mangrovi]MBB5786149.1 hypothetical protein [Jiangella mangrovi]